MREQILAHAIEALKEGGYENLSFATIADELGMSRANLHHHFKNKEGLALAATQAYIDQHNAMFELISQRHHGDYFGFVSELEGLMLEMIGECGNRSACICAQLVREQDLPASLPELAKAHFADVHALFVRQIREAQANGQLDADVVPEHLASKTCATIMGVAQMALAAEDIDDYIHSVRGILTESVPVFQP